MYLFSSLMVSLFLSAASPNVSVENECEPGIYYGDWSNTDQQCGERIVTIVHSDCSSSSTKYTEVCPMDPGMVKKKKTK